MEKNSSSNFIKGDIVTYDKAYAEREKLEITQPYIQARYIQEINDDGTILLDGTFTAIPLEYVLPIPIDCELAKQIRYNESNILNNNEDIYSIAPFMETLSKHPIYEQLKAANLQYVHEVQHWLADHGMRKLVINVFYGIRPPVYV